MRIIESSKSETAAAKASIEVIKGGREEYAAGVAKIRDEEAKSIEQKSTWINEKTGGIERIRLLAKTLTEVHAATAEKISAFDIQFEEEEDRRIQSMVKAWTERFNALVKAWTERFNALSKIILESWRKTFAHQKELDDLDDELRDHGLQANKSGIDQRKSLELAALENVDAYTIQDKIALEQRKTAIETAALRARTEIELKEIDIRTDKRVEDYERDNIGDVLNNLALAKEHTDRMRAIGEAQKKALKDATGSELDVAAIKQATETKKLVTDQYRSIFDSLKQQAGGVFDALLQKSTSVWQAIGNTFKNAMLTAIKDVVSSRVAAMLTELVTGSKVSFARGGNGVLGGLLGTVPVFAGAAGVAGGGSITTGGGSVPSIAAAAGLPGILGAAGVPNIGLGGTPPFFPSSGGGFGGGGGGAGAGATGGAGPLGQVISGATGSGGGFGGIFSKAGFSKSLANLKSFVGLDKVVAGSGIGGQLHAIGHSDAAALGGGLLGLDGLKRGGYLGLAEDTAGGALLGYKFGGPLGAAIGASIGAVAGAIRLLWEPPIHEAKRLVKQIYGVNIDTKMAQQIVDLAKSKYSGHVSIAVRDPDIRKMLELYAAGTGQKIPLSAATPHSGSLVEQGGSLSQASSYLYGQAYQYQSNLPTLGGPAAGGQWPGGPVSLQLNVGGQGAGAFMAGQVVTPDFVQAQWNAAAQGSNGRTANSAMLQQPGLVIA